MDASIIVYDFDHTIYNGDSTLDFYFYCITRRPTIIVYLPAQILGLIKYLLGIQDKTLFKQSFFMFLKAFHDIDKTIDAFWIKYQSKIKAWYLLKNHNDDVIISASPEFLLKPICNKVGVKKLIASKVNKADGKYSGFNCYGAEKVKRLDREFNNYIIEEFYSDSLSDVPLAKLAKRSYFVKKDTIADWNLIK